MHSRAVRNKKQIEVKMSKTNIYIALLLSIFCLSGCATHYSSKGEGISGITEVILCSEKKAIEITYKAITTRFPAANVNLSNISGTIAFAWYHKPFLDKTNFNFTLTPHEVASEQGKKISGYTYSINTSTTQWGVNSRYVQPLVATFHKILEGNNIERVVVN